MQQTIHFKSSGGTNLVGILNNPNNDVVKTPVMLLSHGFSSNKGRTTYLDMEKHMSDIGVATFRLDFFGHGDSGGDLSDITLTEAVDNAHQAFNLLKERGFQKIGLFGSSFGGCVVLNLASKLKDKIYCLVCKCPVSDYSKQKERKLGQDGMKTWIKSGVTSYDNGTKIHQIKYGFYEDMRMNNVHEKAHLITVPTLIVHGTKDDTVLPSQSKQTAELISNCTLELVDGANHRFNNPGERLIINGFFKRFIYKHLAAD